MMLSTRTISQRIRAVTPRFLSFLLRDGGCNCNQGCKRHWYVNNFSTSSLTSLHMPTGSIEIQIKEQHVSTIGSTILVQARDTTKLSMEIETAMHEGKLNQAWKLYEQHMNVEGLPRKTIVSKLLQMSAESLDIQLLEKAYALVERAIEEGKQNLLEKETLIYLSFSLAKCSLPIQASTILRKLVEMEEYPPVTAWSAILAHMSLIAPGSYLAAELIVEISYLFQDGRVDPRKKVNAPLLSMKPDTTAFNISLAGCLLFGKTRKAEQLLDLMPRIGVKADTNLLIMMAQIYEKNGRREELKKLERYVDESHNLSDTQFRKFYNCLLKCHLKFGDLDCASKMVLDMLRKAKAACNSVAAATFFSETDERTTPCLKTSSSNEVGSLDMGSESACRSHIMPYAEFCKDRKFSKLVAETKELFNTLLAKLQSEVDLITTEHGILQPTERIYVKLVRAFLEAGKTKELAEFLNKAGKEDSPVSNDDSPLVHVINTCISLGWLDKAYDLLDEMSLAGFRTGSSVYASLLKAYCKANRPTEVTSLLRDARRAGVQLDSSCYETLIESRVLQKDTPGALLLFKEMKEAKIPRPGHQEFKKLVKHCADGAKPGLMTKLLQEITEGQKVDYGVHDWNNVIHFFCRKRLMQDAEKAFKKMTSLGYTPNAQTFHSMVTGYAAIGGKYLEVTELWGEMKSLSYSSSMKFDQELLDSVLYTFVRGGFFSRANDVVGMMEKEKMFIDKYKYRTLFLKYHKTLYKGKAPKFQTESQLKKRESALTLKKWVGLS